MILKLESSEMEKGLNDISKKSFKKALKELATQRKFFIEKASKSFENQLKKIATKSNLLP